MISYIRPGDFLPGWRAGVGRLQRSVRVHGARQARTPGLGREFDIAPISRDMIDRLQTTLAIHRVCLVACCVAGPSACVME